MAAASTAFVFLLLLAVASARDLYWPIANDAEKNFLVMDDSFDLHDLVNAFVNEVSSFENYQTEFSRSCLEISRKAKEAVNDQSLINGIDNLASTLCHIVPSDIEAKLGSNATCTLCRNIFDTIDSFLGNTDKQLVIILYLLKACEVQTLNDQCKTLVFTFGPFILSSLQTIVSKDLCYMVGICEDSKNQTEHVNLLHIGKSEPYLKSKIEYLDLM